jgi:hypothetical protein
VEQSDVIGKVETGGGWERLEFGSRLYSSSSFMVGGRWGNEEGYVEGYDAPQARV